MLRLAILLLMLLPVLADAAVPLQAEPHKRPFLRAVRQVWGLEHPAWLAAQVGQESGWRDGLTSTAGAKGICQFIGPTAFGIENQYPGLASLARFSPQWCFWAQSLLMADLYAEFGVGRTRCEGIRFAGSAYNGGPGILRREAALCAADWPDCDQRQWSENVAVKNARAGWAWRENRTYVSRITRAEGDYAAQGWGTAWCP